MYGRPLSLIRESRTHVLWEPGCNPLVRLFKAARSAKSWNNSNTIKKGSSRNMLVKPNTLPCRAEQNCTTSPENEQTFADIIRAEVHQALRTLDPKERTALCLSFGIDCYAEGSYHDIGRVMGISCYAVRYLIFSALMKLRHEPNLQMLVDAVPAVFDWYGDPDSYGIAL